MFSTPASLDLYRVRFRSLAERQTEVVKVALLKLLQCIRYTPGQPVASAQVQSLQKSEISKLRRYIPTQPVLLQRQTFQVREAAELRRYLTVQLVVMKVQPQEEGEAPKL